MCNIFNAITDFALYNPWYTKIKKSYENKKIMYKFPIQNGWDFEVEK